MQTGQTLGAVRVFRPLTLIRSISFVRNRLKRQPNSTSYIPTFAISFIMADAAPTTATATPNPAPTSTTANTTTSASNTTNQASQNATAQNTMPSNAATTNKNPGANPTAAASSTGANGSNNNSAAAAANNENRGLPYYEKLRRELRDTLQKKRLMDKSMVMDTSIPPHSLVKKATER